MEIFYYDREKKKKKKKNGRGGQHQMLRCIVGERINDRSAVERSSGGILAFEEE